MLISPKKIFYTYVNKLLIQNKYTGPYAQHFLSVTKCISLLRSALNEMKNLEHRLRICFENFEQIKRYLNENRYIQTAV